MSSKFTHRGTIHTLTGIALIGVLVSCGSEADGQSQAEEGGEPITLRLAHYQPAAHTSVTDGTEIWMEEVEERTDGQVEFDYYPSGQLVDGGQIISALTSGTVDIGTFVASSAASSELPLSELPTVPGFEVSSLRVLDAAYQDILTSEGPVADEWEEQGIQPIMSMVNGSYQFVMQGEPRQGIEDWQGRSIRASGVMSMTAQELGASAVDLSGGGDQYEGLERGIVDSNMSSIESIPAYDFHEVLDAGTTNAPLGGVAQAMAINSDTYDSLPENVRTAMAEATEVAIQAHQDALEDDLDSAIEETSDDMEYYELTEEDLDDYLEIMENVQERWASQRENGEDAIEQWRTAIESAESATD